MKEFDKKIWDLELEFKNMLQNDERNLVSKKVKFKDIIYIGELESTDGRKEKLFIVIKDVEIRNEKGEVVNSKEIKNYYIDDKCIGGFIDYKIPVFNEDFKNTYPNKREVIEDLLDNISREELESHSFNTLQKEYLKDLSEQLGISEEEILEVIEIDLEEKISERSEQETEGQIVLDSRSTDNLDIKEETSLNQEIKGETLREKLGLDKVGINDGEKLVRISKSQLSSKDKEVVSNSVVDIMAVVTKDGSIVVLGENVLKPNSREGTNPTQENLTLDVNDAKVCKEVNTTSYEIVQGNGREFLNIGYDENSGKEIKYSMYSHQEAKYVDIELETNRTLYQNSKVREFLRDRNEGIHEADEILNSYTKENLEDMSRDILNNTENGINEVYNQADVKEKILQKIKEKNYTKSDYEKLIREVEEEMQESAKKQIVRGNMS